MAKQARLRLIVDRARHRTEAALRPAGPEDLSCLCTARPRSE